MDDIISIVTKDGRKRLPADHGLDPSSDESPPSIDAGTTAEIEGQDRTRFQRYTRILEIALSLESRGVERVPETLRQKKVGAWDYFLMVAIWFSANCTANNITVGVLGPILYGLGLKDAMMYV